MGIKQIIKKTPLIKLWRKYVRNKEQRVLESFNREYKKHIDPMLDPNVLKTKIQKLKASLKDPDLTYYVISLVNTSIGIFGYINYALPHIAYAVSRGYVPVIDMKNYPSIYQENNENAWEKFFYQPCDVSLDDIIGKKILYSQNTYWYRWLPNSCPLMSDRETKMWGTLYKHFVRYNDRTVRYLQEEATNVIPLPEKTIGALYRGTDYAKGHAIGHPIQPTKKIFADKVNELMLKHGYEYIYLASDEKEIVEYMNMRFPGKVLINQRVFYDEAKNVDYTNFNKDHIGVSGAVFERENNSYLIGIEYISSMDLVANCSSFVAGACGGTTAVLYMNNLKFYDRYIFNLGKYGFDPVPVDDEV